MKSKKVTLPVMMMTAITRVATPFSACDQSSSGFLRTRSASTPPMREKNICGAVKAKVTKARFMVETVISYTSQPCATSCMFMAKAEPA